MKILGIDPGPEESGWVIYNSTKHTIEEKGISNNEDMLLIILTGDFDRLAIEMIASYGMPVGASTFNTVLWIGRFYQQNAWRIDPEKINTTLLYKKTDINPTICYDSRAKDANIRQALLDMFPSTGGGKTPQIGIKKQPGPLFGISSHMWAALAVAITYRKLYANSV